MKYKEKRFLNASAVKGLCIEENWYTNGNNEEYKHLLNVLVKEGKNITTNNIVAIATDIKQHSNTEHETDDISYICYALAKICYTFFEEQE